MNLYDLRRIRHGKTKRERESGVHENRFANQKAREEWQRENRQLRPYKCAPFPVAACNGRRNRYRVTGKKGETVFLR